MTSWLPTVLNWLAAHKDIRQGEQGAESIEWLAMVALLVTVLVALSATLDSTLVGWLVNYILYLVNSMAG